MRVNLLYFIEFLFSSLNLLISLFCFNIGNRAAQIPVPSLELNPSSSNQDMRLDFNLNYEDEKLRYLTCIFIVISRIYPGQRNLRQSARLREKKSSGKAKKKRNLPINYVKNMDRIISSAPKRFVGIKCKISCLLN